MTPIRESSTTKPCELDSCGKLFHAERSTRRYCSRACQHEASNNSARSTKRAKHAVQFIAIDGEGVGRGKDHKYVLLGCGQEQLSSTHRLHWETILEFLWANFKRNPTASYVGFFLSYDFAQWFRTLPPDRAWRIFSNAGAALRQRSDGKPPLPVDVRGERAWQIDCLGLKRVRFRPKGSKQWMYINDAGPFFQSSFLTVIEPKNWDVPVCTPDEYELVKRGKEHRSDAQLDDDMKLYNRLENELLARVMVRYNEGLVKAGVFLSRDQWYGPGQAAQTWLRNVGMPTGKEIRDVLPQGLYDFAVASYYAGWFEIMAHGHIRGTVFEYDINSAYPFIMAKLPCLLHGKWTTGRGEYPVSNKASAITLLRASVRGSNRYIGAMLHRCEGGGKLARPQATKGVYWAHEIEAAKRAGLVDDIQTEEWWHYEPCACPPPLHGLAELYKLRLDIGKDTAAGKAFKLIYNSAYGKFAQSVGSAPFGNPIYASLITSGCRTMILDAIATHPGGASACVMVATDGVYFIGRHPSLKLGKALGEWEKGVKQNLTLFKPGVYWDDAAREAIRDGRLARFKARGVNAKAFSKAIGDIDKQFTAWDRRCLEMRTDGLDRWPNIKARVERHNKEQREHRQRTIPGEMETFAWPKVKFNVEFTMTTIGQALQWKRWEECGDVIEERELTQSSYPVEKRDISGSRKGSYDGRCYRSRPYEYAFGGETESTPYERRFGQDIEEQDVWQELMTPDGSAAMLFHHALSQ